MDIDQALNTALPKTLKKEALGLTMSDSQSPLSDQFDPESVGSAEAKTLAALASTHLTSAYPEMSSSNVKDDSPLRTEPKLLLSDPSIPKWTSDYSSKPTTGQQSSKSSAIASGPLSTDLPVTSVKQYLPHGLPLVAIINVRESRYGTFKVNARIANQMKSMMNEGTMWNSLSFSQQEALHQIVSKISRIVCGDITYRDSWDDIAGYATLVAEELNK